VTSTLPGFEDLPILVQNEIINYVERNPEEELSKLVQLRREMYIAETTKTQSGEKSTETSFFRISESTSFDKSLTRDTTVEPGDDLGLGHLTVLGAKLQTTVVLMGWALCLVTTLVVLLVYHYRYTIWVSDYFRFFFVTIIYCN
jgi:hypothetical protein